MKRLTTRWRVAIWVFNFINIGGAIEAVAMREPMHAVTHIVLFLLTAAAYAMWRKGAGSEQASEQIIQPADQILDRLQQSVDAIAIEVERIGESQRYNERLLDETSHHLKT